MGTVFESLNERLREFIAAQKMFFVATAPLSAEHHVHLAPKGLESLHVLDDHRVAYLDLVGSGIETVAHLRENGRLTILFCAFEGAPKILRLQGKGRAIEPHDAEWPEYIKLFEENVAARSVIVLDLDRISDSCGYSVPRYEYVGQRTQLVDYSERKGADGLAEYKALKNRQSVDGLPGLRGLETT